VQATLCHYLWLLAGQFPLWVRNSLMLGVFSATIGSLVAIFLFPSLQPMLVAQWIFSFIGVYFVRRRARTPPLAAGGEARFSVSQRGKRPFSML
jgi:hypothetical protein